MFFIPANVFSSARAHGIPGASENGPDWELGIKLACHKALQIAPPEYPGASSVRKYDSQKSANSKGIRYAEGGSSDERGPLCIRAAARLFCRTQLCLLASERGARDFLKGTP